MIDGLKHYPERRESGLPWLCQIPVGWKILRGKGVFQVLDVRSELGNEEILSVSASDGVIPRRQKVVTMFMAKSYIGHKLCWPGDLVVNSLWAWMQGLGFSKYHGVISSAYSVYRPRSLFANYWRFFHYLLRSDAYKWELQTRSKGVWLSRLQLSDLSFMDMPILVPTEDEANAIVKFLDHVTRRLNRVVQAKQKVIALLNEQKQVIIQRGVTRGLDPNVPLKPSRIPWLGDIPSHWGIRRFRTLVHKIEQGVSPLAEGFLADASSWGVLKAGCVNRGMFRETEHKRLARTFRIDPDIVVELGDVLVSRASGSPSLVGSVAKVESLSYQLILSDKTFRPKFRDFICADFMVYAMNSRYYRDQVEKAISGAEGLANNLPLSSLRNFQFAIPPLEEARVIAGNLRSISNEFHSVITKTEHQIALLQEFRTRLISDVVTGKLDVREAARRVPDEAEADDLPVEKVEPSSGYDDLDSPDLTEREELDELDSNLRKDGTGAIQ